jgi:UTP--glucose-1-phosphate uridylyltransferase
MTDASFDPLRARMEAAGMPPVAVETFRYYYDRLRAGETGRIGRADIEPIDALPEAGGLAAYREAGKAALARAVVIKLNGGLGTTMGMTQAKSLLEVKPGLTFLDVIARQILHLRRVHGCRLPLVLMNSFRTREDSLRALSRYPDLAADVPPDFLQHKVPRLGAADLGPVAWPQAPEHEWCPPGHGDIYAALLTSGMLDALLARGYEYAFVSNADNLGAVLELEILGWCAAERVPFVMEVTERTAADRKGGHLARARDGRLLLREIAQCPEEETEEFQDVGRWRWFNTNNLWVSLPALRQLLDARQGVLGLPMIRNEKPVDPNDPASPRVLQLETAMGAAIAVFEGARALHVSRGRFVFAKAAGDLLALWSDAYELTDDFRVVPARGRAMGSLTVDLDPAYFRQVKDLHDRFPGGAPSLVGCRRLVVRGDVRFGRGVVVRGDVQITQEGPEPRVVPDGAVLAG